MNEKKQNKTKQFSRIEESVKKTETYRKLDGVSMATASCSSRWFIPSHLSLSPSLIVPISGHLMRSMHINYVHQLTSNSILWMENVDFGEYCSPFNLYDTF